MTTTEATEIRSDQPHPADARAARVGLVVIGRNEGERLARCLASVRGFAPRVYVDSGSTDGSVALARAEGCEVVELPVTPPFTAARARNAGLARLLASEPDFLFVQFVDGDCELAAGWRDAAIAALRAEPRCALVFGRLRERHPERSVYNAICDDEWNTPVGEASGTGGNVMGRVAALSAVGFFNEAMIAGEDSELGMRLRKAGWRLLRLPDDMGLHDADITRFAQWWTRARRAGYGYGEMAHLHPDARDPDWPRSVRSIIAWGGVMPAAVFAAALAALAVDDRWWLAAAAMVLVWPLRMWQLARRERQRGLPPKLAAASGTLLVLGKLPAFLGLVGYHKNRLLGRASELIEYKGPSAV